jgi:hypothetical protein
MYILLGYQTFTKGSFLSPVYFWNVLAKWKLWCNYGWIGEVYLYILFGVKGYKRSISTLNPSLYTTPRYMDSNDRGRIIIPNHISRTYVRRKYLAILQRRCIRIIKNKEPNLWRTGITLFV